MTVVPLNEIADGIAGAPSMCFQLEPTTGFFRKAAGKLGVSVLGVEVGEINAKGLAGGVHTKALEFQAAGAHIFTGTLALPAGSLILDIGVHSLVLWDAATSASIIVGDDTDPDGFFTATDLKATDLLAFESNNIEHPGGKAGAYIASEQRKLYSAAARNVVAVVTQVGAGTAGTAIVYVAYVIPAFTDVVTTA